MKHVMGMGALALVGSVTGSAASAARPEARRARKERRPEERGVVSIPVSWMVDHPQWFDYHGTMHDSSRRQESPDIASIAALIGDRVRSIILMALMTGRALTASELGRVAG